MESGKSVRAVEVCQVAPLSNSSHPPHTDFSLPLAFPDLLWLRFPPVERLLFYQLTGTTPLSFTAEVLPKLKVSLSATLVYFPPIAGRLVWPSHSPVPIILCTSNHGVSLTFSISDEDFDRLSNDEIRDSTESHPYIPKLSVSEDEAATLALQITLFPGKGFSIGYTIHHAVFDGKSISLFLKAWSYMCKHSGLTQNDHPISLPEEHTPVFDRTAIEDSSGLASLLLKSWKVLTQDDKEFAKNPRSLKLLPHIGVTNTVRSTFLLSRDNINKLRQKVLSEVKNPFQYLSTFVVTCAYTLVCRVRARRGDDNRKICLAITADLRARLDPPIPVNYFGNCIDPLEMFVAVGDCEVASVVAERISDVIKGLENRTPFKGAEKTLQEAIKKKVIGIAGSTRFGMYGIDFGWGKPKKIEVVSIDRTGGIALAESRDGDGGVEIGLAMARHEMEAFASLFTNGLKDL